MTSSPGGATRTVTETKADINGLDPGVAYTFSVKANSAAGAGAASEATSAIRPETVIKQTPVVLNDESSSLLRRVRADRTLIFAGSTPQLTALKNGDLLTIGVTTASPYGFYGRVTGVETTSTFLAITTTSATLEDAFTQADFSVESGLEAPDAPAAAHQQLAPGVTISEPIINGKTAAELKRSRSIDARFIRQGSSFILKFEIQTESRFGTRDPILRPGIQLNGQITLTGGTFLRNIGGELRVVSQLRYDFKGSVDIGVLFDFDEVFEKVLGSKFHRLYEVAIGPAVFIFVGRWLSKATIGGAGAIGASSDISFENGGVGVNCLISGPSGGPSCSTPTYRAPVAKPLDLKVRGEGNLKVAFPFEYEVLFMGLIGPALAVGPYVDFQFDTAAEHFITVEFGLQGGFTINPCPLFKETSAWRNDDLITWSTIVNQSGPFRGIAVTPSSQEMWPGDSTQLSAQLKGVDPGAIHWRVRSGPGSIDADGRFTSNVLGMAIIEAYLLDESYVGTAAVLVSYGGPVSAPGDVQVRRTVEGLAVRWDPVSDSPNRNVDSYEIQATPTDGSTPSRIVPTGRGTYNGRVDDLNPNTDYQVRVLARSLGGPGPEGFPVGSGGQEAFPRPLEMSLGSHEGLGAHDVAVDQSLKPDSTGYAGYGGAAISDLGLFFFTKAESNLAPLEIRNKARDGIYLVRLNLATKRTELISRDGSTPVTATSIANQKSVAVSGDGSTVAFRDSRGRVLIHRIDDHTTWVAENARNIPVLSNNGRVAAYVTRSTDGTTRAVRHEIGSPPETVNCPNELDCSLIEDVDLSADGNKVLISAVSDTGQYSMFLQTGGAGTAEDLLPDRTTVLEIAQSGKISDDGSTIAFWYERRGQTLGLAIKKLDETRIGADHVVHFTYAFPMDISTDGTYVAYREPNITDNGARLKVYAASDAAEVPQAGVISGTTSRPLSAQLTTHTFNQPGLIYTLYPADGGNSSHPGVWSWVNVA